MGASGLVLAGGASRRFGSDKRIAAVDGQPMLRRAVDAVAEVTEEVLVATTDGRPIPEAADLPAGVRTVTDDVPDGGPLAGLAVGLEAAEHEVVVVLAGDHPWADGDTLRRLRDALVDAPDADVAVLAVAGRPQPLAAAYRRGAASTIRERLAQDDRRAVALLDHLAVVLVDAPGASRTVRDVDEPADLDHAARTSHTTVTSVDADGRVRSTVDVVVGEEPLRILVAGPGQDPIEVTTTMRTPGHEVDLAVGLLHAEGLLSAGEVVGWRAGDVLADARPDDTIVVEVATAVERDQITHRHLPATASCGVCGRASIDDLLARITPLHDGGPAVDWAVLAALPERLRDHQRAFDATGGLHATGIATTTGELVTVREDVGRHNALDAAIGAHVLAGNLPLTDHLVVLSGRIGFELVQKVAVAGATVIVAVGAPSDLAVRTADAAGITLCGFVRGGRGNVYSHPGRIRTTGA